MAASRKCRKRARDDLDDDCDECMPISKRINKLHIESTCGGQKSIEKSDVNHQHYNGAGGPNLSSSGDPHTSQWHLPQVANENHVCSPTIHQNNLVAQGPVTPNLPINPVTGMIDTVNNNESNIVISDHGCVNVEDIQGYDPLLKEEENPHYYRTNSVLYNAHVSRVTRTKSFQMLNS